MLKMKEWKSRLGTLPVCLCEAVVGVLLLIDPVGFTSGIIIGLGALMALAGALSAAAYFREEPAKAAGEQKLAKGLCLMAAGLFCAFNPGWFVRTFPALTMLYGVALLLLGVMRVQWTVDDLRLGRGRWTWSALGALLAITFAAIILCDPFATTAVLWAFTGAALVIEAALDIAAMILARRKEK